MVSDVIKFLRMALTLSFFGSCSTLGGTDYIPGPTLYCRAKKCPPLSRVAAALEAFAEDGRVPLAANAELKVFWYPADHVFREEIRDGQRYLIVGQTWGPDEIEVRDFGTLLHEATHAFFWRTTGDPDYNHAEAPGPWGAGTDLAIEEVSEVFQ